MGESPEFIHCPRIYSGVQNLSIAPEFIQGMAIIHCPRIHSGATEIIHCPRIHSGVQKLSLQIRLRAGERTPVGRGAAV